MITVLCTLYNSLYLDKGLVLYDSLCECSKDFKLYVLCMDDKCFEILNDLNLDFQIPVRLSDFEDGDIALLEAKSNRSMGEYCWTCSSSFIKYIFSHYKEDNCTYIDADMCFYNDPKILVDEMLVNGKSVMVVPHRFPKEREKEAEKVGQYCVEFNTFLNREDSLEVLDYWRKRCMECCSNLGDGIHWGDQKYLEELVEKFSCVHVCMNNGAGVAPWNISLYQGVNDNIVIYKPNRKKNSIVFYHYQGITYKNYNEVQVAIRANNPSIDYKLVDRLYNQYLRSIDKKKMLLNSKYGIDLLIKIHPSIKETTGLQSMFIKSHIYKLLLKLRLKMSKEDPIYVINLKTT